MDNETSLWNKKQDDLTVGDSMKVAGAFTIISIGATVAVFAGAAAASSIYNKIQQRREAKKAEKE